MSTNWRITSISGVLLAAYFIPTWALVASGIIVSPIHGLFDRPSISVALFASDHLQLASMTLVRFAWLLALGRLTVVAFFALFLFFAVRGAIRKRSGGDEALAIAIVIGSVISFASVLMASQVGETAALHLHASELLVMLGTGVMMLFDPPAQAEEVAPSSDLPLEQAQLANNG